MSKRARSPSQPLSNDRSTSSPILDRSSKFVACFAPSISAADLQRDPRFSSATHRIAAWRTPSGQRSLDKRPIFDTGHDDDGEKYGGKTLEKVLAATDVVGAVVVARWYGGVMLGPVRFDHIRHCAHEAINQWRAERPRPAKQIKHQDEALEKQRLVAVLKERDESVTVLRELLAQKKGQDTSSRSPAASPGKVPDYCKLPLSALKKLEQVRDATLGWILKEIEKAEKMETSNGPKTNVESAAEVTTTVPPEA